MLYYLAAFVAFAGLSSAATYPSQYPFENESLVPSTPRPATPSWTFDESDEGGYMYTYGYMFDFTEDLLPTFCFGNNGFYSHQMVIRAGSPPINPAYIFNCTNNGHKLSANSYFGTVADVKICEEGECCQDWWDTYTWYAQDEPYLPYYEDIGKAFTDGGCPEMFDEHVYCAIMASSQQLGCFDQYISLTDRMVVYPCYDDMYNHYSACTLYKVTGYFFRPQTEPVSYTEESSADEVNAMNALYFCPDRVCHPYSYYYPEYAKGSSSSGASGASGASGSESDSSSTDSGAAVFAVSSLLLAALF